MAPTPPTRVERIGHRGAPRELLENTLPSFLRAMERGATALELDVHATTDGILVVHHDPTIGRAVESRHLGRALETMGWGELQQVELAPGAFVPRLTDVLSAVAGRATVYVEIKGSGIERLVCDLIRRSSTECAVHSFDHAAIGRCAEIAPELPRGILFEDRPTDVAAAMAAVGARDVWPHWRLVDAELVDAVHARGGRVIVWTVNSPAVAKSLRTCGVDGLCTDDVRLV
jgi:glycerophosphoryl diester phosphodiesterase